VEDYVYKKQLGANPFMGFQTQITQNEGKDNGGIGQFMSHQFQRGSLYLQFVIYVMIIKVQLNSFKYISQEEQNFLQSVVSLTIMWLITCFIMEG
jgi:hypothetical protein